MKLLALVIVAALALQATTTATGQPEAKLAIVNMLVSQEVMQVRCMGERLDFGVHQVEYGQSYAFSVTPTPDADYYCAFLFQDQIHMFDVYLGKRDGNSCSVTPCTWFATVSGPCLNDYSNRANCRFWSTRALAH